MNCILCLAPAQHQHHVVPRSHAREDSVTVPLCNRCHSLIHQGNPLDYKEMLVERAKLLNLLECEYVTNTSTSTDT